MNIYYETESGTAVEYENNVYPGKTVYVIYGDPNKAIVIFSAIIEYVTVYTGGLQYKLGKFKCQRDDSGYFKNSEKVPTVHMCNEQDIDMKTSKRVRTGKCSYPVFSDKELCKKYIKNELDDWG